MHPLIAIVGRPNVGKSTLFNRLVGGRPALVHDTPGLTRDRRYGEVDYFGRQFRVVDTGGLDPDAEKEVVGSGIHRQARLALEEADAVLFVVDARAGVMPIDLDLAAMLRKLGSPIMLVANKIDSPHRDDLANDLYSLGLGEVYPVSAAHGRGVDEMLEALCEMVPASEGPAEPEIDDNALRVALVGKPNAGKSSLLNRLVGAERALVHDVPGTTTDPIDTAFEFGGRPYVLVDTAGIRRKARIEADTEKISVSMALNQIKRADVVVLVVDGSRGPSEQDARLAGMIEESGKAVVIALNKADLLSGKEAAGTLKSSTRDEMHFLPWAPMHMMSALRGDGVEELMEMIDKVAANAAIRVSTAELNKFFADVCETHPPPTYNGRSVTIHYLTQGGIAPPTFLLWANRRKSVSPAYRRYLANQLRLRYGFEGAPIRIVVKDKVGRAPKPRGKRRSRRR